MQDITPLTTPGSGAGSDPTRRRNLSMILRLLHHGGAQPRSQLTAQSGLNRSTVGALVAELSEHGLVFESDPDPTNLVGRPSPTVQPGSTTVAIAVNPEIDAITLGVVGLGGQVLKRIRYDTDHAPTPREAVNISAAIIEGMRGELDANYRVVGVGMAVPGLVRAGDGLVRWAPHLQWRDAPIAQMLSEATGYAVWAGNDATLGATAERIFGAGRGVTDLVYLNGGASGIGGGVVANGLPIGGAGGYAGEFGHIKVDASADPLDPEAGSLEAKVNRAELLSVLGLSAADSEQLDEALLNSNNPEVAEVVQRQLEYLSVSLRNVVNVLNPQVIVLGGFLSSLFAADPEFLLARVEAQSLAPSWEGVRIVRAALGAELLMIGAAELAFAGLLADPAGTCAALAAQAASGSQERA